MAADPALLAAAIGVAVAAAAGAERRLPLRGHAVSHAARCADARCANYRHAAARMLPLACCRSAYRLGGWPEAAHFISFRLFVRYLVSVST